MRRRGSGASLGLFALALAAGALGWRVAPYLAGPGIVAPARAGVSDEGGGSPPSPVPALPDVALPSLDTRAAVERNLFALGRRPVPERKPEPEPPAPAPAAPPPPPPPPELGLSLVGIARSDGGGLAVLAPRGGGGSVILAPGESHRGWVLDSLGERSAVFVQGPHKERLVLDFTRPR